MSPRPEARIGDAERNRAVEELGEHYALGRLNREEFDERSERVWGARFGSDLAPLFVDLPSLSAPAAAVVSPAPAGREKQRARRGMPRPLVLLLILVAVAVLVQSPFLLFVLLGLFLFTRRGRGHRSDWHHGGCGSQASGRDRAPRGRWE